MTGRDALQVFHGADLALHQEVVQRLHTGDFRPVRRSANIQLHSEGDLLQDGKVKRHNDLPLSVWPGDLHKPISVILGHKFHVDAAQVLNALQEVLLCQLHGRSSRSLQCNNGGGIVRPGISQSHVGGSEELLRISDGNVDKLADLRADRSRVHDLRNIVHIAVDRDGSADPVTPFGNLRLIEHDLRIGKGHKGDHGHGK